MNTRRQGGVALITALLVVAIATVAAVAMANRQQLDIRRTGGLLHGEQAWAYVLGAENWARVVLRRDAADSQVDTLAEDWSTQPPVSFVEGGSIVGRLIDLQGRFNLNNLVNGSTVSAEAVVMYKRLLRRLELDEGLADSLIDWIDPDINTRFPNGAEDEAYLLLDPPYRAANQPLVDVSELRLIKGYTAEAFAKLEPHVTALPQTTKINVNTADAVVLSITAEKLSLNDGESLYEARPAEGYKSADIFAQESTLKAKKVDLDQLGIQSQWFLLLSEANVGQGRARLASLLQRQKDEVQVVARRRVFSEPVVVPTEDEPTP